MRWFTPGLIFGALIIAVDVALRHATLATMTAVEQRQYALSLAGCLLFWLGVGAIFSRASQMRRWLRVACTSVVIIISASVITMPYWVWLNLGRFPNREMVVFLANEWGFVSRMGFDGSEQLQ